MLTFNKKINNTLVYPIYRPYNINEVMFFDIETTGFSAKTSIVYLIGCMYYHEESWHILQWILDDLSKEKELLLALSSKLKAYKRIIHYNGTGFDIPYLMEKYKSYNIDQPFSSLDSFDLYKTIIPYKKLFPLANLKLQTLQDYLGFKREDIHSGGDLINVFSQYVGRAKLEKLTAYNNSSNKEQASSKILLDTLLLHNYDDVAGMLDVCDILPYIDFINYGISNEDIIGTKKEILDSNILFTIETSKIFPHKLEWLVPFSSKEVTVSKRESAKDKYTTNSSDIIDTNYSIIVKDNYIYIKSPILTGKLKYFFDNYKDYYYLPVEDTVVHKSLAVYVDKEYKIKAKPDECYTNLESVFIPVTDSGDYSLKEIKTFKDSYKSYSYYNELDTIINSKENLMFWFNSLISNTLTNKDFVLTQ